MNVEVETQTGQVACPGSCGKVVVKPGWEHENTGIMTPETAHLTMHCCAPITKSSAEKLVELLLFLESVYNLTIWGSCSHFISLQLILFSSNNNIYYVLIFFLLFFWYIAFTFSCLCLPGLVPAQLKMIAV